VIARAAIDGLIHRLGNGAIVSQCLYEYWVVATRPKAANRLGRMTPEVEQDLALITGIFVLLPDDEKIFSIWKSLVVTHAVSGKSAHDTRIVAAMQVHGVHDLLTFNVRDFRRYSSVVVHDPAAMTAQT
jgi:hypothetical protein